MHPQNVRVLLLFVIACRKRECAIAERGRQFNSHGLHSIDSIRGKVKLETSIDALVYVCIK